MNFTRSTQFKRHIMKTGILCLARHADNATAVHHYAKESLGNCSYLYPVKSAPGAMFGYL